MWDKESKEAKYVRKLAYKKDESIETYRNFLETRPAEVAANIVICLIHQCNFLLNQQIRTLETNFIKEGGLRERMYRARQSSRNSHS